MRDSGSVQLRGAVLWVSGRSRPPGLPLSLRGLREEGGDLALQRLFGLAHPAVAHGLGLRGVGEDLRPVECHVPQAHQPGPLTELQHLAEQPREGGHVTLPRGGQAVVIGRLVGRQHPVGDLLVGRALNLTRGRLPHAVGVEPELHHHRRVVRRLPAPIALVGRDDRRQIERLHHIADEQRQVAFGEPVTQSWGQQEQLVGVVRVKCFHALSIPRTARVSSAQLCAARFFLRQAPSASNYISEPL